MRLWFRLWRFDRLWGEQWDGHGGLKLWFRILLDAWPLPDCEHFRQTNKKLQGRDCAYHHHPYDIKRFMDSSSCSYSWIRFKCKPWLRLWSYNWRYVALLFQKRISSLNFTPWLLAWNFRKHLSHITFGSLRVEWLGMDIRLSL